MTIENFTPVSGFLGGMLIGAAVVILFWLSGRIAGISGIVAGTIGKQDYDTMWRWSFLAGLVAMALSWPLIAGTAVPVDMDAGIARTIVAGLLVGFGTRLGCGCTSGHGIAGLARLSPRSAIAVATFFAAAVLVATSTGYFIDNGAGE